jgi:hypothetical protein
LFCAAGFSSTPADAHDAVIDDVFRVEGHIKVFRFGFVAGRERQTEA